MVIAKITANSVITDVAWMTTVPQYNDLYKRHGVAGLLMLLYTSSHLSPMKVQKDGDGKNRRSALAVHKMLENYGVPTDILAEDISKIPNTNVFKTAVEFFKADEPDALGDELEVKVAKHRELSLVMGSIKISAKDDEETMRQRLENIKIISELLAKMSNDIEVLRQAVGGQDLAELRKRSRGVSSVRKEGGSAANQLRNT